MKTACHIAVRSPDQCSELEVESFIGLVTAGGEVTNQGLRGRVMAAAALLYARYDRELVGVAALKNPQPHYRSTVVTKSGIDLPQSLYPYELGWVFVTTVARGKGYGTLLSRKAIEWAGHDGVFSTSRQDNVRMHNTLLNLGFVKAEKAYASRRDSYLLQLFTRPGH